MGYALTTGPRKRLTRRLAIALPLAVLCCQAASGSASAAPSSSAYLQRCESTRICAAGNVQRLLGYNYAWAGPVCGGADASSLEVSFAHIAANSKANVIRAGMFQTYVNGSLSFAASDRYVASAKRYGLRLVPVLADEWGQCENPGPKPKRKYLAWYRAGFLHPESLQNGTGATQPLSFKAYAEAFARHYANEPTIAFYQLINEPDGLSANQTCSETRAKESLRSFSDTLTEALKAVDPHHMVDLGDPQICGVNTAADYAYVAGGKSDLCDAYHDYTKEAMPTWIKQRLEGCVGKDKKPAVAGEAGLCAFLNSARECVPPTTATTLQNRANLFKAKLQAGLSRGLSGYIIWSTGNGCSGTEPSNEFVVGPTNASASCAVPEVDPTEPVLASFG
jgi:mannan endo-1,4-beta-mannosidase